MNISEYFPIALWTFENAWGCQFFKDWSLARNSLQCGHFIKKLLLIIYLVLIKFLLYKCRHNFVNLKQFNWIYSENDALTSKIRSLRENLKPRPWRINRAIRALLSVNTYLVFFAKRRLLFMKHLQVWDLPRNLYHFRKYTWRTLLKEICIYLKEITLSPGNLKAWGYFSSTRIQVT